MLNVISLTRPILVRQRSFHEIYMNNAAIAYSGIDMARVAHRPTLTLIPSTLLSQK